MKLTDTQIAKYQAIYFEAFGKSITKDEALKQGLSLLQLVKNLTSFKPDQIGVKYKQ